MEDIQRHTACENFQKPECPYYESDLMNDLYLIKEDAAGYSGDLPARIDDELCRDCDEFTAKT